MHRACGREVTQSDGRTIVDNAAMARRKSLRNQLYRAARDLGNVQAAPGDPTSYGMRVMRRKVYRTTNGINQRVLREMGL
jgi:hypothetical protein